MIEDELLKQMHISLKIRRTQYNNSDGTISEFRDRKSKEEHCRPAPVSSFSCNTAAIERIATDNPRVLVLPVKTMIAICINDRTIGRERRIDQKMLMRRNILEQKSKIARSG